VLEGRCFWSLKNTVLPLVVCNDIMDFSLRNWKSKSLAASVCKLS
jgi:hypothetical protein